jgi:hypothetical protein
MHDSCSTFYIEIMIKKLNKSKKADVIIPPGNHRIIRMI